VQWHEIDGWFQWRSGQEDAVREFPAGSCFVEVGTYLGRSLCSLGDVVEHSGRTFRLIGIDTCRGSGPEGPRRKDYHGAAVADGGGTFAGTLHRNILAFADRSIDWVHLDARHDYESVKADIATWLPKVKPGGWISGDDYDPSKWPEVTKAVGEMLPGAEPWSIQQWRWIVA
jgi:hypothetical protein